MEFAVTWFVLCKWSFPNQVHLFSFVVIGCVSFMWECLILISFEIWYNGTHINLFSCHYLVKFTRNELILILFLFVVHVNPNLAHWTPFRTLNGPRRPNYTSPRVSFWYYLDRKIKYKSRKAKNTCVKGSIYSDTCLVYNQYTKSKNGPERA